MLDDLFKPAWKSSSVEKRLKAISAMNSASLEKQKILAQLAADDEDVSVCIAAIQKLTPVATLHEISVKHDDDSVRAEAEKRLNELMSAGCSLNEEQYRDLLKQYPALTVRVAAYAELPSVRTEAIQRLAENQLVEVLGLTGYTDARQLIAETLTDTRANIETLESARKILRGKDKNAERILKTKIDEFRSQERQHAENLATVEKLIKEVEYLVSRDWRAEFKAKLLVHRERWDKLDFEIDPEMNQRYQAARQIIDARFEQQNLIEQAQQSQQQLFDDLDAFLRDITGRDLTRLLETLSETSTRIDQFSVSWQQLAVNNQPEPVTHESVEKMLSALQSANQLVLEAADILQQKRSAESDETESDETEAYRQDGAAKTLAENTQKLNAALKKLKWPAAYGELQAATELQAQLSDWQKAQAASAAEHQEKLDSLHKKISSIFRFSRAGNLARAKQFCERVEKGLHQFEGKELAALEERYQEARKTLGDMGDWKNFATEPKYVALCEAMERLVTSKLHPDKRSSEMKALQQQWKKLGNSDISDLYWPRFKEAADKVYQPCAEFFEKRHELRKTHLAQRQPYVDQMQELLEATDWDNNTDYKAVQSSLRSISDHFTAIKDVERGAGEKQWKQFKTFKDQVKVKLDVVYEANIKLKHQLIEQAETLAAAEVKEENLAKLKALQTRWKQVGITRRNEDQKAWSEFKKQGDLVFNKVQALRHGQKEKTDQQVNAYRDIIKAIQQLASTAKDLAEADQLFSALQAKYAGLPELPLPESHGAEAKGPDAYRSESPRSVPHRPDSRRHPTPGQLPEKLAEGIQRDYRKACDQFDECRSRIIRNKHARQMDALRQKAALCVLQEALGESPPAEKRQQIAQQWDAIELHDAVLSRRIEQRRNSAQAAIDRVAIGAERRMLCLQLEIAMGAPSPAEDKALRMQYQLEQMNKSGLGQQTETSAEQLEQLEIDWLCMPGAEPELQKELDERFQRALRSEK